MPTLEQIGLEVQLNEISASRVRHIVYLLCSIMSTVSLIVIAWKIH